MKKIYLDSNATTPLDPIVLQAMLPYLSEYFGNPNSLHLFGEETYNAINVACDQLYTQLNILDKDNIIITSGATESINTVYRSILDTYLKNNNLNKNQIITSPFEHPSSSKCLEYLSEYGIEIITLPSINDNISLEYFQKIFNPDKTLLVSLVFADSETGVILPIKEIAKITQKHNTLLHTDATQVIGKIPINIQELGCDFLSFSAHKFHGPKGIGGLYIKNNTPFTPLLYGGGQMGGYRAGTLNTSHIIGMGKALEIANNHIGYLNTKIASYRNRFEDFITTIPNTIIYGKSQNRIPNTSFIHFSHIDKDYLAWHLNKKNIAISTGTACTSKNIHNKIDLQKQGVRFSLSRNTTEDDINITIQAIKNLL